MGGYNAVVINEINTIEIVLKYLTSYLT